MILEILWCVTSMSLIIDNFYPIDNFMCPILTPGVSRFDPKLWSKNGTSLKVIFLVSKSH